MGAEKGRCLWRVTGGELLSGSVTSIGVSCVGGWTASCRRFVLPTWPERGRAVRATVMVYCWLLKQRPQRLSPSALLYEYE